MAAGTSSSKEIGSELVTRPLLRIEGVGSSISVGGQSNSSVSGVSVTSSDAESIGGVTACSPVAHISVNTVPMQKSS